MEMYVKYEDDIFITGHREETEGKVLKRSGAYLDIHVLSPSWVLSSFPGLGLGQPTKIVCLKRWGGSDILKL